MPKTTIIHHKIDPAHYTADAFVVWCFDARFKPLLAKFYALREFKNVDEVKMAGGAKVFATPEIESEEMHYRGQLEKSIKLHHTKYVILMAHANCGAYGKRFESEELEEEFYINELNAAKKAISEFLKSKDLNIPVETYYADFSGLHLIT